MARILGLRTGTYNSKIDSYLKQQLHTGYKSDLEFNTLTGAVRDLLGTYQIPPCNPNIPSNDRIHWIRLLTNWYPVYTSDNIFTHISKNGNTVRVEDFYE